MLHVVATPIGNLGDLTPRAQEALKGASLIACEDTRRTWQLLSHFGIPRPEMISYRQGNEDRVSRTVIDAVNAGREVVLVSDGGYPAISDPGYRLVRLCAQENVPFDVLPGASAVNVALVLSGLPTSSFTFKGFPPRGPGALRNWFAAEKELPHTLIGFESPFRIGPTLQAAYEVFGDREAVRVAVPHRPHPAGGLRGARRPRGGGVHRAHEAPRARRARIPLGPRRSVQGREGEGRSRFCDRRREPEVHERR